MDVSDYSKAIAEILVENPWQKSVEISIAGMTGGDAASLLDAIFAACGARGVDLKGIVVDAAYVPLPQTAPFSNAFYLHGKLVVIDLNLNDAMIVRRT